MLVATAHLKIRCCLARQMNEHVPSPTATHLDDYAVCYDTAERTAVVATTPRRANGSAHGCGDGFAKDVLWRVSLELRTIFHCVPLRAHADMPFSWRARAPAARDDLARDIFPRLWRVARTVGPFHAKASIACHTCRTRTRSPFTPSGRDTYIHIHTGQTVRALQTANFFAPA